MKQKKKNGYNLDDFGLLFSEASEKSMLLRKKNSVADSADSQNLVKNQSREAQPLKSVVGGGGGSCEGGGGERLRNSQESPHSSPRPLPQKNARGEKWDSNADLSAQGREEIDSANHTKGAESNTSRENPQSKEQDFIYAPQFQGFDEILAQSKDASAQDFGAQDFGAQDFSTQNLNAQTQSAESSAKATPQSEKDLLLSHTHTHNDTNALFVAYSILFLMLLIFMPQVYLANNIYTSSKNINLLKSQKDALRDENSDLQKRLESVKFNFLTLEIEEIK